MYGVGRKRFSAEYVNAKPVKRLTMSAACNMTIGETVRRKADRFLFSEP